MEWPLDRKTRAKSGRRATATPSSMSATPVTRAIHSPRGNVTFLPGEARTVRWALSEARRLGILREGTSDATYRRLEVVTLAEGARRFAGPTTDSEE